jgi:thymidylate kinase
LEAVPRIPAFPAGVLDRVVALVGALEQASVSFCVWKSNEHLAAAAAGETDLDLLVDRAHAAAFREVVAQLPIKALTSPPDGRHPATEHYLGFDEATGRLFHVHVQYQLVLGEKYAKNYILPVERQLLDATELLDRFPVPRPEWELAILATRALLKYRNRDVVKDVLHIRSPGITAEIHREIAWLEQRTTIEAVRDALRSGDGVLPAPTICAFLERIERSPRSGIAMLRLRSELRRALRPYRRRSRGRALLAYARGAWLRRRVLRRRAAELRMLPVTGGTTVALVGPDGCGKSTMVGALDDWLGWKLQTRVYYLGSKQPSRRSRALYLLFRALRRSQRAAAVRFHDRGLITRPLAGARDTVRALHCLSIGRDRARRHERAQQDAHAGRVVIFDRFPLEALSSAEAHRVFDGPQIPSVIPPPVTPAARVLISFETRLYRKFRVPQRLVMLRVEPETAAARKPDHAREVLAAKCTAFEALAALANTADDVDAVAVDADQPAEQVLAEIKRAVWDVI